MMCDSSILQKPFKTPLIQSIKIHLEWSQIQDMGAENVYIYSTSYS